MKKNSNNKLNYLERSFHGRFQFTIFQDNANKKLKDFHEGAKEQETYDTDNLFIEFL